MSERVNKVFVVMGNDYPDAVFTTEAAAEAHCDTKKITDSCGRRIYWRFYEFELRD